MTMRTRYATLSAALVLLGAGLVTAGRAESYLGGTPAPAAIVSPVESQLGHPGTALALAEAAADRSLGERAMDTVRVLADDIGSRPAGSANEQRAADYLAGEYRALGYEVTVTPFPFSVSSGRGESRNVEARSPNEDPNARLVILGGHYDTVPAGPGANDNGSGTATILEVARELAADPVPGVAVRYIAFGAEEIGLLGSKAYVNSMSENDRRRTALMMSIDMMAVGDQPAFGGTPEWVFQALARAESQGFRAVNQSDRLRRMSDHASFIDAGMPGIMFHWLDDPFYHTALDISANVRPDAMDLMGAIAIELVRVAAS
jgi:Zn-dependent M28 family amino/carboxypeptidase